MTSTRRHRFAHAALALACGVFVACGAVVVRAQDSTPVAGESDVTIASLADAAGNQLGMAAIAAGPDGQVTLTVIAQGLTPGEHGIHVHETGLCDPSGEKPFTTAGAHLNPAGVAHGDHAGDLGNLTADADGDVLFAATSDQMTIGDAAALRDADGSAVVIHADPDDLVTDPSGNSGARIACAVVFAAR